MNTNDLNKLNNEVKSMNDYWRGLSPAERREAVIQFRDAQVRRLRQSIIGCLIFGITALAATIFTWHNQYRRSLMSSLGIAGGVLVAGLGFRYLQAYRVKSYPKLFLDDLSDDDILVWLKEHEEVNQRALAQWQGMGKYTVSVVGIVWLILLYLDATKELAFTALISALAVTFLGFSLFAIVTGYPNIRGGNKRRS